MPLCRREEGPDDCAKLVQSGPWTITGLTAGTTHGFWKRPNLLDAASCVELLIYRRLIPLFLTRCFLAYVDTRDVARIQRNSDVTHHDNQQEDTGTPTKCNRSMIL